MASNTYFIDLQSKRITLPNSRWYETKDGCFPSVTTILTAKAKQGLTSWQINLASAGVNVKEAGIKAMDEGSKVHDACERIMKGETISFYNDELQTENYKLFEEWLPITRFVDAYRELEIQPILIEQTIYSQEYGYAGTLDLLCTLKPDKNKNERVVAIVDLKRSSGVYTDYHLQLASYQKAFIEMINNDEDNNGLRDVVFNKVSPITDISTMKAYILLLNVDTKKGWRLTEIDNIDNKFSTFLACKTIWDSENPNIEYCLKQYPLELTLKGGE